MQKKIVHIIAYSLYIALNLQTLAYGHAVTYQLNKGRLGDHLLTYAMAKLISYRYYMPLLLSPFQYSDQLVLHLYEPHFNEKIDAQYPKKVIVDNNVYTDYQIPRLYICTLKSKINECQTFNDLYKYTRADPLFKKILQTMIAPINPIELISLPPDIITVAVHVRKGGGYDGPLLSKTSTHGYNTPATKVHYADVMWPTRFPPEIYYIEQIKRVARLYNNKPLFLHIFTDDKNPRAIVDRFKAQLAHLPITFNYRATDNGHNVNVLDDLFNMTRFDCLIRPASSFSKIAQLLGDHKIIIYPKHAQWVGQTLVIDQISIINNLPPSKSKRAKSKKTLPNKPKNR